VDELFSKLKSTEIDYQTQAKLKNPSAPTMALVSGNGSSSLANPSQMSFALFSLVSVTEEQLEALGDDKLALIISRFSRFHNNRLNRRRGGGLKEGYYDCGFHIVRNMLLLEYVNAVRSLSLINVNKIILVFLYNIIKVIFSFFERSSYPALIYNKRELATAITCARSAPPHSLGCKGYRTISKLITRLSFAQRGASESSLPLKNTAGTSPSNPRMESAPLFYNL
jgi:hypothetical protein